MKFSIQTGHDGSQQIPVNKISHNSSSSSLVQQPSLWDATADNSTNNPVRPQVDIRSLQNMSNNQSVFAGSDKMFTQNVVPGSSSPDQSMMQPYQSKQMSNFDFHPRNHALN